MGGKSTSQADDSIFASIIHALSPCHTSNRFVCTVSSSWSSWLSSPHLPMRRRQRYEAQLKHLLPEHEGYQFIRSLSGASINTYARMIGALGDDRQRYTKAQSLQSASGNAPITTASGKSRYVSARWACSKFMCQASHEYAGLSKGKSRWLRHTMISKSRKENRPTKPRGHSPTNGSESSSGCGKAGNAMTNHALSRGCVRQSSHSMTRYRKRLEPPWTRC